MKVFLFAKVDGNAFNAYSESGGKEDEIVGNLKAYFFIPSYINVSLCRHKDVNSYGHIQLSMMRGQLFLQLWRMFCVQFILCRVDLLVCSGGM